MSDLLARLDENSPWIATLAVLGVGVLGATIAGLATSAPEDRCATPLVDAPQWPDDARERLMHVFRTSTLGDGEALGRRVVARLDGYLSDWKQAELDVCRDAVDDPEELEARHACLGLRAVEFESLLEVLATGQSEVLARSLGAAARLTPPESCATTRPSRLARDVAPHDDRLNDHLARASTALSAGDMELAMRHADAALASAGDDYGRARATMVRYRVLDKSKDHTAAAKEGEEALRLAIRAGADEVAADATRLLVYTAIAGQGEPEHARRWAEHADAWLTRLGDPVEGRLTLDAYRGFILRETRKYEEAELLLRDVLRRALSLDPPLPQKLVSIRLGLASTLQHTGDHGKAEAELNAALDTIDGELGVNHPARLGVLQMLSALMWRTGRSDEGIALSLEVVAGYERLHGAQSPSVAEAEFNLGLNMFGHGDFEGARKHTQAALAVFEAHGNLKRQDMAVRNLSQIALMTNDLETALDLGKRDVELAKQVDDKPEHVIALVNVAMIRNRRGDYEEAYDTAKRISELASVAFEATDPFRAFAWLTLGNTAKDVGKLDEARAAFEAGIALLRATTGERDPNWVFLAAGLADAHYQAGRYDDALALLEGLDLSAMHRDEDRLDATRLVTVVHVARNDHAAAREALSRARGYAETIGTAEATAMIDELAATVD